MKRGIVWTALQMVGSNLISLVVFVVLGRLLSPRAFGLVAAAMVIVLFLRVVVDAGFSRLLVQRETITGDYVDTAFWTAIVIGVIFCALLMSTAPLVALIFGQPGLTNIVRALSVIFIFVSLDGTQSALLERRMEFRSQAIRRLIAGVASAAVAVTLAVVGAGVWALVAQQLTLEGITVLVLWTLAPWRPRLRFSRASFRELAAFGLRYSASQVLVYLGGNADNLLVGLVLGPVALGYYVVAYRIFAVAVEVLVTTVNRVALTTFSRLRSDTDALNEAFIRATRLTAYVTLPCFTGLALLAHPLITLVFGMKWSPSAPVLQVLTVAGVVQGQLNFTGNYAIALGRLQNHLVWLACLVGLELVGFGVTVSFGIVAVGASLSLVVLLAWPLRLRQVSRWQHLQLKAYLKPFLGLLLATAVMAAAMLGVGLLAGGSQAVLLVAQLCVGAFTYVMVSSACAPAAAAEIGSNLLRLTGRARAASG